MLGSAGVGGQGQAATTISLRSIGLPRAPGPQWAFVLHDAPDAPRVTALCGAVGRLLAVLTHNHVGLWWERPQLEQVPVRSD